MFQPEAFRAGLVIPGKLGYIMNVASLVFGEKFRIRMSSIMRLRRRVMLGS
jgi:hypothetical protein